MTDPRSKIAEFHFGSASPEPDQPTLCGEFAASFIPRLGAHFACVLPKGHKGEHRAGGECNAHGKYVMPHSGQSPQCPEWPKCIEAAPQVAAATPPPDKPAEPVATPELPVCWQVWAKAATVGTQDYNIPVPRDPRIYLVREEAEKSRNSFGAGAYLVEYPICSYSLVPSQPPALLPETFAVQTREPLDHDASGSVGPEHIRAVTGGVSRGIGEPDGTSLIPSSGHGDDSDICTAKAPLPELPLLDNFLGPEFDNHFKLIESIREKWRGKYIHRNKTTSLSVERWAIEIVSQLYNVKRELASLLERNCPDCGYPREKHCKNIGLTEKQENSYIPCEYCFLKRENQSLRERLGVR